MTDKRTQAQAAQGNMQKDPADWVTGDEPMTGAQRSYLQTLCEEAREPFDDTLIKAEASRRIDELQARTGRGAHGGGAEPPQQRGEAHDASALQSLGQAISAPVSEVVDAPPVAPGEAGAGGIGNSTQDDPVEPRSEPGRRPGARGTR